MKNYDGAGYNPQYDSYYDPKTGAWIEDRCGHEDCEFCANRPAWATPTTDDNIDARIEAWHDGDFKAEPEPLIEFLGLTWEQYSYWVRHDKLPCSSDIPTKRK